MPHADPDVVTAMPVVISIAGSDSGGGAGIQADLKTFEAFGVFGTTAITSITAQNTVGVRTVHDLPHDIVRAQLDAIFDDFAVAAIKIGMLSSAPIIALVAGVLRERAASSPIVLDPVMVATSGDRLLREEAVAALIEHLLPLATLVTPNSEEAAILAGREVANLPDMRAAAHVLVSKGAAATLVKGGHIAPRRNDEGVEELTDLFFDGTSEHVLSTPYIPTTSTHGTGCTTSSAIAAMLAKGVPLLESVVAAQRYVHGAILHAPGLGAGSGPLRHGWGSEGRRGR
jgi:hydroxymethylpyrimidine/phosphomethylpyrimidine kinase